MTYTKAIALAITLLLAGCNGTTNLRLNEDLTTLYTAKLQAERVADAAPDQVLLQETISAALRELATRAASAAEQAPSEADAVSYFRIAATAAWQGGSADVESLSRRGWEICERPGFDAARRDCVMLLVIPDLAATDRLTLRLDEQIRRADAEVRKPEDQRSQALLDEIGAAADEIFASLKRRFETLEDAGARFPQGSVPDALLAQLHRNEDFIYCRMQAAQSALLTAATTSDPRFVANRAALDTIRQRHDADRHVNCGPG